MLWRVEPFLSNGQQHIKQRTDYFHKIIMDYPGNILNAFVSFHFIYGRVLFLKDF
jgi:hypothetical protein